jgi:hypothetical protein
VAHTHEIPVFNAQHGIYSVYGLWDLLPCILEIIDSSPTLHSSASIYAATVVSASSPLDPAVIAAKTVLHKKLRTPVAAALGMQLSQFLFPFSFLFFFFFSFFFSFLFFFGFIPARWILETQLLELAISSHLFFLFNVFCVNIFLSSQSHKYSLQQRNEQNTNLSRLIQNSTYTTWSRVCWKINTLKFPSPPKITLCY